MSFPYDNKLNGVKYTMEMPELYTKKYFDKYSSWKGNLYDKNFIYHNPLNTKYKAIKDIESILNHLNYAYQDSYVKALKKNKNSLTDSAKAYFKEGVKKSNASKAKMKNVFTSLEI